MRKKLIIWDLDGVIADSEKVWLKNRQKSLNEKFNLNWDFDTVNKHIGGMSDSTKKEVLDNMGYKTDQDFWDEQLKIDIELMQKEGLEKVEGVEDIIKKLPKQCIATGGIMIKTINKLKAVGLWQKYFNESNTFTVDNVKKGKPEPDIFLYAAKTMGENVKDCIVIEDSIAGMTAAKRAGIECIAFLGCDMYDGKEYLERVKNLGVDHICFNMGEVAKILFDSNKK